MTKSYLELITLPTFLERYEYLKIGGRIGEETFGFDRYLNQVLYRSSEWKRFRRGIILRDNGCDLGCEGYEVYDKILIHHINPITVEDVINRAPCIFDPNNVISTSLNTHNAIHYGDSGLLVTEPIERTKNDTCPWKNKEVLPMSNKKKRFEIHNDQELILEPELVEETIDVPEIVEGTVSDCNRLRVRNKPNLDGEVLMLLDCNDKVVIELDQSTEEWFKVRTVDGTDGFCMRKFISI